MKSPPLHLLLLILTAWVSPTTYAEVHLSLPLEGWYRPGKYMPVRVHAPEQSTRESSIEVRTDGSATTRIEAQWGVSNAIAPILMVADRTATLRWTRGDDQGAADVPLRALTPRQKLVGLLDGTSDVSNAVFPNNEVIVVRLDPTEFRNAEPLVWQSLDLLITTPQSIPRSEEVEALALAGVAITVRGEWTPPGAWTLRSVGGYTLLLPHFAGPSTGGIDARVFAPVQGRRAQWPEAIRRRVLLFALILSLLTFGLTLLPTRWITLLTAALCLLGAAAAYAWWGRQQPLLVHTGTVAVEVGPTQHQRDDWRYFSAVRETSLLVSPKQDFWLFESQSAVDRIDPQLLCDRIGRLQNIRLNLSPSVRVACVTRSTMPRLPTSADGRIDLLTRSVYPNTEPQPHPGESSASADPFLGIAVLRHARANQE